MVVIKKDGNQQTTEATSQSIQYVKGMDGRPKSLLLIVSIAGMYVNG